MKAALVMLSAVLLTATAAQAQDASTSAPAMQPPTAPAPPSANAVPKLSESELQQLGLNKTEPAVNYDVKLSGFIDFGSIVPLGLTKNLQDKPSFYIGNLNVYLSKSLTESLRTMVEVRLLYLPNGSPTSLQDRSTTISTVASDYNDYQRELHWGGVEIERVYAEWTAIYPLLTIRAGQFLTPYGIWNVDHGSPTVIPTTRPFVIGYNFFPERQTGFELYGHWDATNYSAIGYHLTLSNGTGPASEYRDLDSNKAVGGRLFWEYRRWGELKLGGSAYYGRNTDATNVGTFTNGKLKTTESVKTQSDSLALALDAAFKYERLHVQAELVTQQLAFTPPGRTLSFSLATFQNSYPADSFRWGGYLLLGYRFEWLGVMPYVVLQRVGGVDSVLQAKDRSTPVQAGLNIRPIESLVGKVEYTHVFFDKGEPFPGYDIDLITFQLSWAF